MLQHFFYKSKEWICLVFKSMMLLTVSGSRGGDTDTLDNLCTYYGYNLSTNIHERTGIECAKAINYCYHKMEEYSRAQGK